MTRERRGPIAWMAQNAVAANLLMGVFIIGGLVISGSVKQEVFPEFSFDQVNVSVAYPGASPEEVEKGVLIAIEEAIRAMEAEISAVASQKCVLFCFLAYKCHPPHIAAADVNRNPSDVHSGPKRTHN